MGWVALTVLVVVLLNFFLFRVLPGDPARSGIHDPRLKEEAVVALQARFGLDRPIINCVAALNPLELGDCGVNPLETQLAIYVGNLLQGELGISYHTNRPVSEMLREQLWNTVLLLSIGQALAIAVGMGLGILAAWRRGSVVDYLSLFASLFFWSLPTFWLGIVLLFWGSAQFGLPTGGIVTPGLTFDSRWEEALDIGRHLLLPTVTYTLVILGQYVLLMRSSMQDVLSDDYILTARAKGLSPLRILKDHALRNGMIPMVTLIALNLGFTVAGAIQIETVFSWPGLGRAIFLAVGQKDYPMLQGAFLLIAVSVIIVNLIADLLYAWLDPRVREEMG